MTGIHRLCAHLPFIKHTPLYVACAQMACAALFFSMMGVTIRFINPEASEIQIIFLRNIVMLMVFLPGLLQGRIRPGVAEDKANYGLRGLLTLVSMFTFFASIRVLPLPTVIALTFTVPLLTSMLAALFLKEIVGLRRWTGMGVGLFGALIIIRPFSATLEPAVFYMCFTALMWAGAGVLVKAMAHKRSPEEISCGIVIVMTPLCGILVPFVTWHPLEWADYGLITLLGWCAIQGQTCVAAAFSKHDVSAVLPFDFLRLPFSSLLAFLLLGEMIDGYTLIGAAVIAAAALYVAGREAKLRRERRRSSP